MSVHPLANASQDRFIVPPFDVDPAIIAQSTKALLDSFDAVVAAVIASSAGSDNANNSNKIELTNQHIAKMFKDVSDTIATDSYASLMGVQYPTGTSAALDADRVHKYEFLMPYVWQRMRVTLEHGKNAGKTIPEMRADIAATERYWTNTAYNQIQNDLLPFIVRGSKILLLGEGRLVSHVVQTALQFANTSSYYVLEGRPEMPHQELNAMLSAANNSNNTNNNTATGSTAATPSTQPNAINNNFASVATAAAATSSVNVNPTVSSPSGSAPSSSSSTSCCGQRLIDKVCGRNPSFRSRMRLIPDSCAASVLQDCNFVLLGAYCATKNGGIVHRAGSLQLAMLAKAMNIPVYVLCESYKFSPIYPLSTGSISQPHIPEGWREHILQRNAYAGLGPAAPSFTIAGAGMAASLNVAAASPSAANNPPVASPLRPSRSFVGSHANGPSVAPLPATPAAALPASNEGASAVPLPSSDTGALVGCHTCSRNVAGSSSSAVYHGHNALEHAGGMLATHAGLSAPLTVVEPLPTPSYLEFVPGDLITFFFTDRRILPPSGVVGDIHQTFPLARN